MKNDNPLGQTTHYLDHYDPDLLYPIPRRLARQNLMMLDAVHFHGYDCWTAYELSWLNLKGRPEVRVAEFYFDVDSVNIIESKSLKLYLNGFNQTTFSDECSVQQQIVADLTDQCESSVKVDLYSLDDSNVLGIGTALGQCLDSLDITVSTYDPDPSLLTTIKKPTKTLLYSHLLRTNCPITDQPDWATVFIEYQGPTIQVESLLAYIISFRQHQDYHEHCIERIFCDIKHYCQPQYLTVYARYTRRGGLDINPFRSDFPKGESELEAHTLRLLRQ